MEKSEKSGQICIGSWLEFEKNSPRGRMQKAALTRSHCLGGIERRSTIIVIIIIVIIIVIVIVIDER